MNTNVIYRHNYYGPSFGGTNDLNIGNSCTSNANSRYNKYASKTWNNNLLGVLDSTIFQVSYYEVYKVL